MLVAILNGDAFMLVLGPSTLMWLKVFTSAAPRSTSVCSAWGRSAPEPASVFVWIWSVQSQSWLHLGMDAQSLQIPPEEDINDVGNHTDRKITY